MADDNRAVEDILDTIEERSQDADEITLGDLVGMLDNRGVAPFLVVIPLIELSPVGAVPGVPTLLALVIALMAGQLAAGREDLWLPGFLKRRGLARDKLETAVKKSRPPARWLDRHFGRRLPALAGPGAARIAAAVILALCLTVPPLELIPWASSAPMLAIAFVGLALLFRDGLVMALGFAASVAAGCAALWWLL